MRTSMRNRTIAAVLVAGLLAPVAPAMAGVEDPFGTDLQASSSDSGRSNDSSGIVLRRDSTEATPFVAEAGAEATPVAGDGFDWGDAAIGAGVGLLTATFAALGAGTIRDRRENAQQNVPATPQSA